MAGRLIGCSLCKVQVGGRRLLQREMTGRASHEQKGRSARGNSAAAYPSANAPLPQPFTLGPKLENPEPMIPELHMHALENSCFLEQQQHGCSRENPEPVIPNCIGVRFKPCVFCVFWEQQQQGSVHTTCTTAFGPGSSRKGG